MDMELAEFLDAIFPAAPRYSRGTRWRQRGAQFNNIIFPRSRNANDIRAWMMNRMTGAHYMGCIFVHGKFITENAWISWICDVESESNEDDVDYCDTDHDSDSDNCIEITMILREMSKPDKQLIVDVLMQYLY